MLLLAGGVLGSGSQFVPFIHVDDLASLYVHVLENPTCHGVYNGVAPQFATNRDFTKALGAAMDRPTIFPVPKFALNLVFGKERASMLLQSQKVCQLCQRLLSGV
jgi:NAD dependent epimerase/dehydratase family enzyme